VRNISKEIANMLINYGQIRLQQPKLIALSSGSEKTNVFSWSKSELIIGNTGKSPYVENRNMVLISITASFIESQIGKGEIGILVTGFRDEYPDTMLEFVNLLNSLFAYLLAEEDKTIAIETPIIHFGKEGKRDLVAFFIKDYRKIINLTWSCYEPKEGKPCGECFACISRDNAIQGLE
jgi:7-cyano-7-deazaguanine synthase